MFSLGERLRMCASLVRKSARLVDVGTDHAYLPVSLLKSGHISYAVAADVNEAPLESGRACAEKYGAENIEFRLGDGLSTVTADDGITDAVIAGMGGDLIGRIILDSPLTRDSELNLIVQPMTRQPELIKLLYKNGFELENQLCARDHDKIYTAMTFRYTGEPSEIEEIFAYTGKLDLKNPECRDYLAAQARHLEKKSIGDAASGELASQLRNLIKANEEQTDH